MKDKIMKNQETQITIKPKSDLIVMVSANNYLWKFSNGSAFNIAEDASYRITPNIDTTHNLYNKYYQNVVNALEDALEVAKSKLKTGFHWSDCATHDSNNDPIESCDCEKIISELQ